MSSSSVSVVVIFLDGEVFLEEAIRSVQLQTHSSWELLLVDDGSRDASSEIARRAAETDPKRVRYLQHPDGRNHGTSASRNLGAAHADGTYLLFLDCDDLLLPQNLARHVRVLDSDPNLGAVFSPTLFWLWDPSLAAVDRDSLQSVGGFGNRRIAPPELLLAMLRDESLHPANCGSMFRRPTFEACGRFDEGFAGLYEDTALLTKLLLHHPSYMIGDCLSAYRAHRNSQCHVARGAGEYEADGPSSSRLKYLTWAKQYCQALAHIDRRVLPAIEQELSRYRDPRRQTPGQRAAAWPRRGWRRLRRILGRGVPEVPGADVISVMRQIRDLYQAAGLPSHAEQVTARIAELECLRMVE